FAAEGRFPIKTRKGDRVAAAPKNRFVMGADLLEELVSLERMPDKSMQDKLRLAKPGFVWFDVDPAGETGDKGKRGLRWGNDYAFPAPVYRLRVGNWPTSSPGVGKAPEIKCWFTAEDSGLESTAKENDPAKGLEASFPPGGIIQVNASAVTLESVTEEERPVITRPGGDPEMKPCLVVRLKHQRDKPVWVTLTGLKKGAAEWPGGEGHHYFTDGDKSTAIFWVLSAARERKFGLRFISLD